MATIAIEIDKDKLRDFCRRWKITEFALFGSVTRPEEFRADSDVDVLVKFAPEAQRTFQGWLDMRDELIAMFGREVDLVERGSLQYMRNYLRREAIISSAVLLDVA
jgi:predicted nucleotidyltransferase